LSQEKEKWNNIANETFESRRLFWVEQDEEKKRLKELSKTITQEKKEWDRETKNIRGGVGREERST
jgi:hypothetical protein